ncbi:MAG TPA: sulfur carrier protein ThiS [Candidatus Polarisedimenticolia bacterium]|jgi:thiamine biosynthesis protein ThiS|nr:sulfur carrier protein ThiS [Candidatus Polarisedimenticolia bacterium]
MQVRLNGVDRDAAEGTTLLTLVESLRLPQGRLAVERNGLVVPRAELDRLVIKAGDVIEVVHFVGGG